MAEAEGASAWDAEAAGELDGEPEGEGAGFRRRLETASYQALLGEALRAVLAEAAAERSLVDEIGALRVTLARLLVEEDDIGRLATNVARVAAVAVQAARTQAALATERPEDMAATVVRALEELGKGDFEPGGKPLPGEGRREGERDGGADAGSADIGVGDAECV